MYVYTTFTLHIYIMHIYVKLKECIKVFAYLYSPITFFVHLHQQSPATCNYDGLVLLCCKSQPSQLPMAFLAFCLLVVLVFVGSCTRRAAVAWANNLAVSLLSSWASVFDECVL